MVAQERTPATMEDRGTIVLSMIASREPISTTSADLVRISRGEIDHTTVGRIVARLLKGGEIKSIETDEPGVHRAYLCDRVNRRELAFKAVAEIAGVHPKNDFGVVDALRHRFLDEKELRRKKDARIQQLIGVIRLLRDAAGVRKTEAEDEMATMKRVCNELKVFPST